MRLMSFVDFGPARSVLQIQVPHFCILKLWNQNGLFAIFLQRCAAFQDYPMQCNKYNHDRWQFSSWYAGGAFWKSTAGIGHTWLPVRAGTQRGRVAMHWGGGGYNWKANPAVHCGSAVVVGIFLLFFDIFSFFLFGFSPCALFQRLGVASWCWSSLHTCSSSITTSAALKPWLSSSTLPDCFPP